MCAQGCDRGEEVGWMEKCLPLGEGEGGLYIINWITINFLIEFIQNAHFFQLRAMPPFILGVYPFFQRVFLILKPLVGWVDKWRTYWSGWLIMALLTYVNFVSRLCSSVCQVYCMAVVGWRVSGPPSFLSRQHTQNLFLFKAQAKILRATNSKVCRSL